MLCKYKNSLGIPGEGIHKYRVFNIAIVDVIMTIIGAFIIHRLFFPKHNFWVILLTLFVIGIIMHRIFCVRTTVDKLLFPNVKE